MDQAPGPPPAPRTPLPPLFGPPGAPGHPRRPPGTPQGPSGLTPPHPVHSRAHFQPALKLFYFFRDIFRPNSGNFGKIPDRAPKKSTCLMKTKVVALEKCCRSPLEINSGDLFLTISWNPKFSQFWCILGHFGHIHLGPSGLA